MDAKLKEVLVTLGVLLDWDTDIMDGGPIFPAPGRKAVNTIAQLLEDPELRAVVDPRIASARARLEARRRRDPEQNKRECDKPIKVPGFSKLPRPLFREIIREMLEGEATNEIVDSTDLVRGAQRMVEEVTRELPVIRDLPRKRKKRRKKRIDWRAIALVFGIALLAGNRYLPIDHLCIDEIALMLVNFALRARGDDD